MGNDQSGIARLTGQYLADALGMLSRVPKEARAEALDQAGRMVGEGTAARALLVRIAEFYEYDLERGEFVE